MARPVKNAKSDLSIFQSYVLTAARYDLSIYEKRILYCIVEIASNELKKGNGTAMRDFVGYKIEPTLYGKRITIPVRKILANEVDKNYTIAKKAFKSLATKGIEYEDEKVWSFTNIITSPKVDKTGGLVSFNVENEIWECCWNFAQGYRKLEFITIMQFKSIYSMRFYELMSGQKKPLYFSIEELRKKLCIENKLKAIPDFEKRVLDIAADELHKYSPYAFVYEREVIPSRGRTGEKVIGYTFYPEYIPQNDKNPKKEEKSLQAKIPVSSLIPPNIYEYLINKGMTKEQLSKNKDTIYKFCQTSPDPIGQIAIAFGRARGKSNEIGYFINTLKGMTHDLSRDKI